MRIAGAAVIALVASAAPGLAADPGVGKPSSLSETFDWTGFYLGVQAGGAFGKQKRLNVFSGIVTPYKSDGFAGALHGGYNHQIGRFVLGAEGEIGYGNVTGNDGNAGGTLDATTAPAVAASCNPAKRPRPGAGEVHGIAIC